MSETNLSKDDVLKAAMRMRLRANHHITGDWQYSRDTNISRIINKGDFNGYGAPTKRVKRFLGSVAPSSLYSLLGKEKYSDWEKQLLGDKKLSVSERVRILRTYFDIHILGDRNLPDGGIENAAIITYWEEDGEYLQYMQPSVANKICDFLETQPENPAAVEVAREWIRIEDNYSKRLEEVSKELKRNPLERDEGSDSIYWVIVDGEEHHYFVNNYSFAPERYYITIPQIDRDLEVELTDSSQVESVVVKRIKEVKSEKAS